MDKALRHGRRGVVLFLAVVTPMLLAVGPAFAQGWTFAGSYGNHAACLAAGSANPRGAEWKCVVSSTPGGYDLYLWG